MDMPHVKDWMTVDPVMIRNGSSLAAARNQMQHDDVHRLLVVDGDGGLVGIVTWGDVVEAWPSQYSSLESYEIRELMARVAVDEVMSSSVITIDPDATVNEAVSLMFENRMGALPVADESKVVGILTNSDILQGLVRVLAEAGA